MILATHVLADGATRFDLGLPADHPAFDGHFPGAPILPAVVQIDWVVRIAGTALGLDLHAACDFRVKCQRAITPGDRQVALTLRVDRAKGTLDFAYAIDGVTASSGRIFGLAP